MICIIALIVFGVLGIFSLSYRALAYEALDCVFRRVTLRKCHSGLDQRLRSKIAGKILRRNLFAGKVVYKYFEVFSWFFVVLLFVSIFFSARGLYFYGVYGNCNGPNDDGFCIFDPLGSGQQHTGIDLGELGCVGVPGLDNDPSIGPIDAPVRIVEFGCFRCSYTKQAVPVVKQILKEYEGQVLFQYKDLPIDAPGHRGSMEMAEAAQCAFEQGKFWEYHDLLFEHQGEEDISSADKLVELAGMIELDTGQFRECVETHKHKADIEHDYNDGVKQGIYGTPTFFINNKKIVGPKPFKEFKKIIDEELEEYYKSQMSVME